MQPNAVTPPESDTIWKIIADARQEMGWSAAVITAIFAVVSLSGAAILSSLLGLLNVGPIGADDTLNLIEIGVMTAPLTLAIAIFFAYSLTTEGSDQHPAVPYVVLAAAIVGMALLFGALEYGTPDPGVTPTAADPFSGLPGTEPLYSKEGVSLDRALQEANKFAHPIAKAVAFVSLILAFYIESFGFAAFLAAFVLAFQLARFYTVYRPRLLGLARIA